MILILIKGSFNSNISSLEYIDLDTNKLMYSQPGIFDTCTSLKYLQLSKNNISHIDPSLFPPTLLQIEFLSLSHNRLSDDTQWQEVLQYLNSLTYLNISHNAISSWNVSLSDMTKLQILDLSIHDITHIVS